MPHLLEESVLGFDEAKHALKVLRRKAGDILEVTNGEGIFGKIRIISENEKNCLVEILETYPDPYFAQQPSIHLCVALTKGNDRFEWMTEKAIELGATRITPLITQFAERSKIRIDRIEKIALSAMKQSLRSKLPIIDEPTKLSNLLSAKMEHHSLLIAHCYPSEKKRISELEKSKNSMVLIGPEGDFSEKEVQLCLQHNALNIDLGNYRLRTETAAVAAVNQLAALNS